LAKEGPDFLRIVAGNFEVGNRLHGEKCYQPDLRARLTSETWIRKSDEYREDD
jgi:hypothetical protein